MSITVVGSTKGGTGKSTLSSNLSVLSCSDGYETLLVDTDRNNSVSLWSGLRGENAVKPRIPTVRLYDKAPLYELPDFRQKYQRVFVDCAGHDSVEFRSALIRADIFLLVLKPSQFDLWSLENILPLLEEVSSIHNPNLKSYVVLNQASTHHADDLMGKSYDFMQEYRTICICKSAIKYRKSFQTCVEKGLSVSESSDKKAISEINALYKELYA